MRDDLDALRGYLAGRDVACPNCGYNLRGLTADACPECNQALELGVRLTERGVVGYLATLAAACALGGAGAVSIVVFLVLSWHFGNYPPGAVFLVPAIGAVLGTGAALLLAHPSARRWFRRRSSQSRVGLAIVSWLVVAGLVASYTAHLIVVVF